MSIQNLFYCRPSLQYHGTWQGDPETDYNEFKELGYIEVPFPPDSGLHFWDPDKECYYLPASPEAERTWRDGELAACMWLRERHRDQQEIGHPTTLSAEQFVELLTYMQALRDWPQSPEFPAEEHRPQQPIWINENRQ